MDLPYVEWPLPYVEHLEQRRLQQVDLVVIHCTELPDLAAARRTGEQVLYDSGTGNSGHIYIDRDGEVSVFVPLDRIAHHTRGYNPRSVGIELVNTGRWPDWLHSERQTMTEPYPAPQIDALIDVLDHLQRHLPTLQQIAGHEDLDTTQVPASDRPERQVYRKRDPGPLFPWLRVLERSHLQRLPTDASTPTETTP
ncbi:MAG: N-acetylmuramoyl-L-alanine amidase [Lysobacteraceae bacterium]